MKKILTSNFYPLKFIDKLIKIRINKLKYNNQGTSNDTNNQNRKIMILPYIPKITKPFSNFIRRFDVNPVYKIPNKLNYIVKKGKDKLLNKEQQNVVYKIECGDCKASYIGQTKRVFDTRLKEHQRNIKEDPDKHNVITLHKIHNNHVMQWDNAKNLDVENNYKKRLLSEMLHIKTTKNTLNKQKDTDNSNNLYTAILFPTLPTDN